MIEPNEKTQADNRKDKTAIAFLYQALSEEQLLQITKHNDNGRIHHYDDQGGGRYIPPHSQNRDDNRQHGKGESFSQDYNEEMRKPRDFSKVKCYNCNEYGHYASHCRKRDQRQQRREASNLVEEDLEPTLLMASTSFNKTQRKSSKDTPTNKSIWFAKDYDHEDSKFGEIILEEDEGGHDQDYDKLRSNENEDIKDTAIVITGENIGPKPNPDNHKPAVKDSYKTAIYKDLRFKIILVYFDYGLEIRSNIELVFRSTTVSSVNTVSFSVTKSSTH
ncbi:zinc finger, CCHC-type containing protein, partial [Tanacetum coccineum]